jgi:hypothetical protein
MCELTYDSKLFNFEDLGVSNFSSTYHPVLYGYVEFFPDISNGSAY